jgi:hypothetical protein
MNTDDLYACFRQLEAALRERGHGAQADELRAALAGGATASECLGRAGLVLKALRTHGAIALDGPLQPLVAACVRSIRAAWPHYR